MITATIEQERDAAARRTLAEQCRHSLELIERARQDERHELGEDVDEAERAVVFLRDRLSGQLRGADSGEAEAHCRAALRQVNAALSLVVGVEYPAGGIQRDMLKQAGGALEALLGEGLLDAAADTPASTE